MRPRALWMAVLFLVLLALLMWPPSTIAQEFEQTSLTVNLHPAIHSALTDTGPVNAALRMELVDANPAARIATSSAPMRAGRFDVAHMAPAKSVRSWQFPTFDAFYREISADSVVRGLPQSSSVGWATPGSLTLRSATSYGIRLSFRMPHIRTRTLYRCLLGRSG